MKSESILKIGGFYGLTAPTLLLASERNINLMFETIKGTTSVDRLKDLLVEVKTLDAIINQTNEAKKVVEFKTAVNFEKLLEIVKQVAPPLWVAWGSKETPNAFSKEFGLQTRHLNRAIKAMQEGKPMPDNINIPGVTNLEQALKMKNIMNSLSEKAKDVSHTIVTSEGDISLSPDAITLLRYITEQAMTKNREGLTKIEWIMKRIEETMKSRITPSAEFFNYPLGTLKTLSKPLRFQEINSTYNQTMSINDTELLIKKASKYLGEARSIIESVEQEITQDDLDKGKQEESKRGYLLKKYNSLEEDNQKKELLNEYFPLEVIEEIIPAVQEELGVHEEWFNIKSIGAIEQFMGVYDNLMNNLPETLTVLSPKAKQAVFNELTTAGILGLTVYGKEMLVEELKHTPLASPAEDPVKIDRESQLYMNSVIIEQDALSKIYVHEFKENGGILL